MTAKVSAPDRALQWISIPLLAHCGATLFHFTHNAVFLSEYPNMPSWLSASEVGASWLALTSFGIVGYLLFRFMHRLAGLAVLSVYAILGFDGFAHYGLAAASAHTATMNATIWLEAITATLLLIGVACSITRIWRELSDTR